MYRAYLFEAGLEVVIDASLAFRALRSFLACFVLSFAVTRSWAAVIVGEAFDIVLFNVVPALDFDDLKRFFVWIFEAVL